MATINVDEEILKCAINNLTLNEVQLILESNRIKVDRKDKKHELVEMILNKLHKNELSEQVYLALKTKAFSTSSDFYDGFFYKYNEENVDFSCDDFMKALDEQGKSENSSKQSNIIFEYKFYDLTNDDKFKILIFTFSRESKKGIYDYKDDVVKFYHNKIIAKVHIYYKLGLVYIHSKNSTESTAIKFFLQKVINKFLIEKELSKVKLVSPKFDNNIVEKWSKKNDININGFSTTAINMLDLLCEFDVEENCFTGFSIKRIYLEHEVIDTDKSDSKIAGLIYWGENLQKCDEILKEISNGKKINGFELEVSYQYENEELGKEEAAIITVNILQESNNYIRITLSEDELEKNILEEAYKAVRDVFLKKITLKEILNTELLKDFLNKCKCVNSDKKEEVTKKNKAVY